MRAGRLSDSDHVHMFQADIRSLANSMCNNLINLHANRCSEYSHFSLAWGELLPVYNFDVQRLSASFCDQFAHLLLMLQKLPFLFQMSRRNGHEILIKIIRTKYFQLAIRKHLASNHSTGGNFTKNTSEVRTAPGSASLEDSAHPNFVRSAQLRAVLAPGKIKIATGGKEPGRFLGKKI